MSERDECFQIGNANTPEEVLSNHLRNDNATTSPPDRGSLARALQATAPVVLVEYLDEYELDQESFFARWAEAVLADLREAAPEKHTEDVRQICDNVLSPRIHGLHVVAYNETLDALTAVLEARKEGEWMPLAQ